MVTITDLPPAGGCRKFTLVQGSRAAVTMLPGAPERGDRTGASLGVAKGDPASVGTVFDTLLIGAPGESIGSATGTGRVLLRRWRDDVEGVFGPIGGDARGLGFGAALAQAQG